VSSGIPQSYLWGDPEGDTSTEMAKLLLKYFSVSVTREVYGKSPTKSYKYAPVGLTVDVISMKRRHDEPGPENFVALQRRGSKLETAIY